MNVVRHNDKSVHVNFAPVFKQTVIEDQGSRFGRQDELSPCTEADIINCSRSFDVRKVSAIQRAHKQQRFYLRETVSLR